MVDIFLVQAFDQKIIIQSFPQYFAKEESRSLVKRAGLKIWNKKSRPLGVRGFESHLLHPSFRVIDTIILHFLRLR